MDLADITDFIARDNPARAFKFEEELIERAQDRACSSGLRGTAGSGQPIALLHTRRLLDLLYLG
jgi:plasmid stabilization system protein ParE